jgi:hypothetical protein
VTAATLKAIDDQFRRLGGDVLGIVPAEYPQAAGADNDLLDFLVGQMIQKRMEAAKTKTLQRPTRSAKTRSSRHRSRRQTRRRNHVATEIEYPELKRAVPHYDCCRH